MFPLRPRPHVSGDFCIRNFFYADTKISASTRSVYKSYTTVHTYPIRIRTSQRISQQSMRITSAYTKIYGYERPHVSGYTAYTEISTLDSVYRNLRIRVDGALKVSKKTVVLIRIRENPLSGDLFLRKVGGRLPNKNGRRIGWSQAKPEFAKIKVE